MSRENESRDQDLLRRSLTDQLHAAIREYLDAIDRFDQQYKAGEIDEQTKQRLMSQAGDEVDRKKARINEQMRQAGLISES